MSQTWRVVHGHSGRIEYENNIFSNVKYKGWGLDFIQKSGLHNWIHYDFPAPITAKVSRIGIEFYLQSIDVDITDIHIWNGKTKVASFSSLSYPAGWQLRLLTLPKEITFTRGLGISIRVAAGVEQMGNRAIISTALAYFTNLSSSISSELSLSSESKMDIKEYEMEEFDSFNNPIIEQDFE